LFTDCCVPIFPTSSIFLLTLVVLDFLGTNNETSPAKILAPLLVLDGLLVVALTTSDATTRAEGPAASVLLT